MSAIQQQMSLKNWALLILLSVLWGGSFFFNGVVVTALPPLTIVLLRVSLAAFTLYIFIRLRGQTLPKEKSFWMACLIMGLLNNIIPFSLIVWGQTQVASGLASILNATTPLFTLIIAHYFTQDDRLSRSRLVGVLSGFLGVSVIIGPDALGGLGFQILAPLAIMGAALSYGFAAVYAHRAPAFKSSPFRAATGQLIMSTLVLTPLALWIEMPWQYAIPALNVCLSILALAILSTALAYIIYFQLIKTAGATNLSLVTFLVPVSAILSGVFILGERLSINHVIGTTLLALGLIIIDGRLLKKHRKNRGYA